MKIFVINSGAYRFLSSYFGMNHGHTAGNNVVIPFKASGTKKDVTALETVMMMGLNGILLMI